MSRIGERIYQGSVGTGATAPRCLAMPAAASAYWQDGRALDSGTAHILDSNLSHLSSESVRHLGWCAGPGSITFTSESVNSGWAGYEDAPTLTPTDLTKPDAISWDERTALRWGPFAIPQDRALTLGGYGLRDVYARVDVDAVTGGASDGLYLFAALTASELAPDIGNVLAWTYTQDGSGLALRATAGRRTVLLVLQAGGPSLPNARWQSRTLGPSGTTSAQVQLVEAWLWIGWRVVGAGGTLSSVVSVSAYESR